LGERFYDLADETLERIAVFPNSFPAFYEMYHRAIILKTPFGIFYTVAGNRVMVGGILDLRQEPEQILNLLRKRG
jgi:hypothetical protein